MPIWTDKNQENMTPVNAAQGLIAAEHSLEKTAERIAQATSGSGDGGDTVSLSEEAVGLLSARNAYEMNLQVLQVGDTMMKKMVDFMA
jgi:flagellar basal body rod protein FlgC